MIFSWGLFHTDRQIAKGQTPCVVFDARLDLAADVEFFADAFHIGPDGLPPKLQRFLAEA